MVIKLGGAALKKSLEDSDLFQILAGVRTPVVIVHGGGPEINKLSAALGLQAEFSEGQRVTTNDVLAVVEMVLRGKIAPKLVRGLLAAGRSAVAISGCDGALFECAPEQAHLGRVGHVAKMNDKLLRELLRLGHIVIISPVGLFPDGGACNVNADLAASKVAEVLGAKRLLFLTDKDGILNAKGDLLRALSRTELEKLVQSAGVTGGMKVKARAMLELASRHPNCQIEVMNGLDGRALRLAIQGRAAGTRLE